MQYLLGLALLSVTILAVAAATREEEWKEVDEAIQKGLPKTAIEQLEPIIQAAIRGQGVRRGDQGDRKKIALEGNIQGNKPEEKIRRMKAEIAKAPEEMQPVMEAVLANWYWHYFQQNRWRFMQRTATAAAPRRGLHDLGPAADLGRDRQAFQQGPGRRRDCLRRSRSPSTTNCCRRARCRTPTGPTLFDFLAHNALDFYSAGEQAGAKPQDAFELMADSPIFSPADEFIELGQSRRRTRTRRRSRRSGCTRNCSHSTRTTTDPVGLHRRGPGAAGVRQQQGLRRGEERPLQGGAEAVHRPVGRPPDLGPGPVTTGPASCTTKANWSRPSELAERGSECVSRQRRRADVLQPGRSRSKQPSSAITTERVWNEPLAEDRGPLPQRDQGLLPGVPYDFAAAAEDRRSTDPEYLERNERKALLSQQPAAAGRPTCRPPRTTRSGSEDRRRRRISSRASTSCGQPRSRTSATRTTRSPYGLLGQRSGAGHPHRGNGEGKLEGFVLDANSGEPMAERRGPRLDSQAKSSRAKPGPNDPDRRERPVPHPAGPSARGTCCWPATKGQQLATAEDYYSYSRTSTPNPLRADDLLHRPLALPARPDDPVQGHLHRRGPADRTTTRPLPDRRSDGRLPRRQRQGDRRAEHQDQRLRLVQRQLHRAARPADGPHDDPRRRRAAGADQLQRRGVQAAQVPGDARRARRRPPS